MVTLSPEDLAAIGALWEKYGDAIGRKDADAAATLFGDDCDGIALDGADVALMNGTWLVHNIRREPVRVRSTLVMRRDPDGWRYVAARFMAAKAG